MRLLLAGCVLAIAVSAGAQTPPANFDRDPVRFTSGRFELSGDLLAPREGAAHPVIVYVWGAGPSNRQRHIERSPMLRAFLEHGYAVFLYDKPGSGESTGEIDGRHQFDELASILIDAIDVLKARDDIDASAIGLYGSSQASYVMASALARTTNVAFVIAWSCPMQNSIEQGAYLVRNYVLCDGGSPATADSAGAAYRERALARMYTDYREAALVLDSIPAIRDGLGWAGVREQSDFTPADSTSESFFDPSHTWAAQKIPILALYAENDRQIDPLQGAGSFRRIFARNADPLSTVVVIPGADHNMNLSPRGCMQDQRDDYRSIGGKTPSPRFIDAIGAWLDRLNPGRTPRAR
ncbi:MAG TPA: alpha/beta fold hydrolase [Candidatus Krumholzibacteria bacterium]